MHTASLRLLVTTDLLARGVDLSHVDLVVNFDLPRDVATYYHRIGRTGRFGGTGKAVTFGSVREVARLRRWVTAAGGKPLVTITLLQESPDQDRVTAKNKHQDDARTNEVDDEVTRGDVVSAMGGEDHARPWGQEGGEGGGGEGGGGEGEGGGGEGGGREGGGGGGGEGEGEGRKGRASASSWRVGGVLDRLTHRMDVMRVATEEGEKEKAMPVKRKEQEKAMPVKRKEEEKAEETEEEQVSLP